MIEERFKHITVESVSYSHHYVPNTSCGTGYDEPDYYNLHAKDGETYQVSISMWYRQYDAFDQEAKLGFQLMRECQGIIVDNLDETIKMCRKCYKEKTK